jgi:hypothetical protein
MDRVHGTVDRAAQLGPRWTSGRHRKQTRRLFAGAWHASCTGLRVSPVKVGEEVGDEAKPRGCSLEHGRWRRGSTTIAKSGGRELHSTQALERERKLESGVERCGVL